jgi:glycerophosphoryl diester phosphodiesterase
MPAFAEAVALGYRYVETDVHVTADGVLVAFHDDALDRVSDRTGRIADLPWSEVRRARVDGREPIPLLEDLLGTWPDLRVNIDPKHDAAVGPLVDVLARTRAVDRVGVGSFSDRRLARLRRLVGPRLCTGVGPAGAARLWAAGRRVPVGPIPAACAQLPVTARGVTLVDARLVAAAHRRGLQVHVWTVDDPAEIDRLLDLGVDGIMTDRPVVLRDVLVARGAWT